MECTSEVGLVVFEDGHDQQIFADGKRQTQFRTLSFSKLKHEHIIKINCFLLLSYNIPKNILYVWKQYGRHGVLLEGWHARYDPYLQVIDLNL